MVSHTKLFMRLHYYSIHETLLCWSKTFFFGCTHCTRVKDFLSDVASWAVELYRAVASDLLRF